MHHLEAEIHMGIYRSRNDPGFASIRQVHANEPAATFGGNQGYVPARPRAPYAAIRLRIMLSDVASAEPATKLPALL